MGRHFSESEVTAMGRNKNEDKNLKQRLIQLKEEKTFSYDNFAKEKKRIIDLMKENRRTSGNTPVGPDEKNISEDSFKDVLLSRRPWSCTPHETTFNVIFREASDPGLLKATYRLKEKGNRVSSRRTSAKSAPNGTRSLAVSRQSLRSEPTVRRPLTGVSRKARTSTEKPYKPLDTQELDREINKCKDKEPIMICQRNELKTEYTKSENVNKDYKSETTDLDGKQNSEQPSSILAQNTIKQQTFNSPTDIPTISIETYDGKDESSRPKSRLKKRLSIMEPTIDEGTENEHSLTKIYELENIKNVTDIYILNNKVELQTKEKEGNDALKDEQQPNTNEQNDNEPATDSNIEENLPNSQDERRISRPSIAFGESLDVVDFSSIHFSDPDEDYIMYKGRPIRNYVKPQLRYKYDPFAAKSRERLIQKLTTDVPLVLKNDSNPVKNHRVYSKGARKRMLKQLVDENNSQNKGILHNPENEKLESKIQDFYDSIAQFCRQSSTN